MMQRDIWSSREFGTTAVSLGLVVLLVAGAFAVPVAAAPIMYFDGADVSQSTALVGENVTVTATVENLGDASGGYTLTFEQNNSQFESRRVVVDADETAQFNETISFDTPGTYELTVNDRTAGIVEVRRSVATVTNESSTQRSISVRARSVSTTQPERTEIPLAANRSFSLEQWTVETAASNYDQRLVEYTDRSAVAVPLPSETASAIGAVVTIDSNVTVDSATVRFSLSNARLRELDIDRSEVTVFQRVDSRWVPRSTTIVESRTNNVVYEANVTAASTLAVGRINADIDVVDTSIQSTETNGGQLLTVDTELRNDGSVEGSYQTELLVNDETVNTTMVSVAAGETVTVSLSHEVSSAGTYELAINDNDAGSVVITAGQIDTDTGPNTDGSESPGESDSTPSSTDSPVPDLGGTIPATVAGIDTLLLGGGVALVLVVLLVVALRRRGGGGNSGGNSGGFEQL